MFKQTDQNKNQSGYLAELDAWVEHFVIRPLYEAWRLQEDQGPSKHTEETVNQTVTTVRKSIKDKVLESYRNGQEVGPRREFKRR